MLRKKGRATRKHLIETAAPIFNVRGFAGTSIAEILAAAGLEKGGLYRIFPSKDALALAAFDYSVGMLERRRRLSQSGKSKSIELLLACINVVAYSVYGPAATGGCPIMNTAIEADDTHIGLRDRAAKAMRDWQAHIERIVQKGLATGELCAETEPATVASLLTSTLEGALMVAALLQDRSHMERSADHLRAWVSSFALGPRLSLRRAPPSR